MTDTPAPRGATHRILLVDDDSQLGRILQRALMRAGHEVELATNGTDALRAARATSFDLVITDLIMPDMEGIQLLRELRALDTPPRIIAMSGGGRGAKHDYLNLASLLGAAATLQKPFTPLELTAAIAGAMGSSHHNHETAH